ncbi:MFS general substrate transporter [Punctularia strigosozonata HHB-11173 SS5]|uniref:MFS general substrate transporter n=1 Tax=Punctularia strigosozonata (strain HHB-11173) TaxID=741275 RepID=UPI0004417181|nr:MFS general substrate transporter [Punctularia strigosozonata HHB-11173 SS5]EIN11672.1 MFS general substrate transporter [Punctularia strigosozonata HHB-11173 SS5]
MDYSCAFSRLLPILIVMYFFNFVDRSNLANARLGGLEKDLHMSGSDFNLATSILFIGYLIMQLPANLLLTIARPSLFLSTVMVVWGALTTCTAAASSFKGLLLVRFWLGFAEAPFFPGAMFVMSSWYTRAELGKRYALLYAGSVLANIFAGLISAAILANLDGHMGKRGWQWIFIIAGPLTIFFAMMSALVLPDYPRTTRWLTDREKEFAVYRLQRDQGDNTDQRVPLLEAIKMALCDYKLYLFIVIQHCNLLSQTFTYFYPTIVSSLGYNKTQTLLLTAPPWFAAFLASLLVTAHAAHTNERCFHVVVPMLASAVGNIIMVSTLNTAARFVAMFLLPMGALPAFQMILTWVSNSFPKPLTKRAAAISMVNMLGNLASVYGSFLWPSDDAPRYLTGGATIAAVCVLCACGALSMRLLLAAENKKLDEQEPSESAERGAYGTSSGVDNRGQSFRYIL